MYHLFKTSQQGTTTIIFFCQEKIIQGHYWRNHGKTGLFFFIANLIFEIVIDLEGISLNQKCRYAIK